MTWPITSWAGKHPLLSQLKGRRLKPSSLGCSSAMPWRLTAYSNFITFDAAPAATGSGLIGAWGALSSKAWLNHFTLLNGGPGGTGRWHS